MSNIQWQTKSHKTKYGEIHSIEISGGGVTFVVEQNRALDISYLSFEGLKISYDKGEAIKHPREFKYETNGFSNNMFFGALTTCGLENTGPDSIGLDGTYFSRHGSINNEEAKNISIAESCDAIKISGDITSLINRKHNFILHREIVFSSINCSISIQDEITNKGEEDQICLMYHINFGAPFLSSASKLEIPYKTVIPKNENAQKGLIDLLAIGAPSVDSLPMVFYMTFKGSDGSAVITNSEKNISVKVEFQLGQPAKMDLWKNLTPEQYVIAFEPCNGFPFGRFEQREKGEALYLKKDETKKYITRIYIKGSKNE